MGLWRRFLDFMGWSNPGDRPLEGNRSPILDYFKNVLGKKD
jgi:hypothetical protein